MKKNKPHERERLGGIIEHDVQLFPNQRCVALNYFCRPARWESGKVTSVEIHIDSNGKCRTRYTVTLDRKTISAKEKRRAKYEEGYKPWENFIRLTVNDESIQPE